MPRRKEGTLLTHSCGKNTFSKKEGRPSLSREKKGEGGYKFFPISWEPKQLAAAKEGKLCLLYRERGQKKERIIEKGKSLRTISRGKRRGSVAA